jgi:hypothetical protein
MDAFGNAHRDRRGHRLRIQAADDTLVGTEPSRDADRAQDRDCAAGQEARRIAGTTRPRNSFKPSLIGTASETVAVPNRKWTNCAPSK